MEDWYLVRNSAGRVGWVLLRMVDLDIPIEVAQYAEGQRIMGYFVLNTVQDGDKQVPQYLVLLNEPKDGLPWDYNQIRIFTWGRVRHRYETAYRERNLEGHLPGKDWPPGVRQGRRPADLYHPEGDRRRPDGGRYLQVKWPDRAPRAHTGRRGRRKVQTRSRATCPPRPKAGARARQT